VSRFRITTIALIASAFVAGGCTTPPEPNPPPPAAPVPSSYEPFEDIFSQTPAAIARDLNAGTLELGLFTAEQIDRTASTLCRSGFDPDVTIDMLRGSAKSPNLLMIGPATRLLALASWTSKCTRPAVASEERRYTTALFAFLNRGAPLPPGTPSPQLSPTESRVCDLLENDHTPDVVDALGKVVEAASRERIKVPSVLPLVVSIAGRSCTRALPAATDLFRKYSGGS
jgi:hypothetical protein